MIKLVISSNNVRTKDRKSEKEFNTGLTGTGVSLHLFESSQGKQHALVRGEDLVLDATIRRDANSRRGQGCWEDA